jgi:hypothetical protein
MSLKRGRAAIPPTVASTFLGPVHQERNLRGCWTPTNNTMAIVCEFCLFTAKNCFCPFRLPDKRGDRQ